MSESPPGSSGPASSWDAFSQDGGAALPPPGPDLAALTGAAVAGLGELTDDQVLGAGSAARRLRAHAEYLEIMAVGEFARRRDEQLEASIARGDRVRSRDGEYAAEELGFEMTASAYSAAILLDMARNIVTRLPGTLAGMAAGSIDRDRARVISNATLHLPDDLAGQADEILAPAAPGLRVADLARKAAVLEAKLDPEGVRARKDEARRSRRVELRQEGSGAASLAGRELDPADALSGKASLDEEAARLRKAGLPGSLHQLRALVMMDRLNLRDPWDRLTGHPGPEPGPSPDRDPQQGGDAPDPDPDADYDGADPDADQGHPAGRAPLPALVNITIPVGTLLGWSGTPADVGGWGLLDAGTIRDLIEAAARHPRTRWCTTFTGPGGEAVAHACAPGPHPWPPPQATRDGPRPAQLAGLLAGLSPAPEPIARGTCDHAHREDRYIPGRALRHLIRARTSTCPAPGCGAQAATGHIDHTQPYPAGDTCEHNLSPPCARHHHAKHAPGWHLRQPQPGTMHWTTPSGRTYTTHPTRYDE